MIGDLEKESCHYLAAKKLFSLLKIITSTHKVELP